MENDENLLKIIKELERRLSIVERYGSSGGAAFSLPDQTGHGGEGLATDGANPFWKDFADAESLNGFFATQTPTADTILPLDENAQFPISVINKNICHIYRTSDWNGVITTAYSTYLTYPLNTIFAKVGTILDIYNDGVKVVGDCSYVKISATMNIDLSGQDVQFMILKNGSTIFIVDSGTASSMTNVVIPPIVVSCAKNDVFTMKFSVSAAGTYLTRGARSNLVVEVIK